MSTLSAITQSSRTESQITTFRQTATSTSLSGDTANYGFIALLGLIQRLGVDLLPLTWQAARGSLEEDGRGGRGGQAKIHQSYISPAASFAYKLFSRNLRNSYGEIVSELLVLTHEAVRKHPFIVRLEGICWDIRDDDDIRPVLVFEKTLHGDLWHFMTIESGKNLSIDDRLRLCIEIGVAIRDMHANNIIHGDIKPRNILVFETRQRRYTAKTGDFGFSTRCNSENDLIYMPRSRIWHAPEWHDRAFSPEDAKRMDIFSFGMTCLWLLFGVDRVLPSGGANQPSISFEGDCDPSKNYLEIWKDNSDKDELTEWAISAITTGAGSKKNDLARLFGLTLAKSPQKRELNLDELLPLLDPSKSDWRRRISITRLINPLDSARSLPKAKIFTIAPTPLEEHFEISSSFSQLISTDFRLAAYIVAELKSAAAQSQQTFRTSPRQATLQLALAYTVGFGVSRNEDEAVRVLLKQGLTWAEVEKHVQAVRKHNGGGFEDGLFARLGNRGLMPQIDFAEYYQERNLLQRARTAYERDLMAMQRLFGRNHILYLRKLHDLSRILIKQRQWEEAERLLSELIPLVTEARGADDSSTLIIRGLLARTHREQGNLDQAEKMEVQVFEGLARTLGPNDPRTIASSASLLTTNWKKRGKPQITKDMVQMVETRKRLLGPDHQSTLSSMVDLGATYSDQNHLAEAEQIFTQVVQTAMRVLGREHPDTLTSIDHLESTYRKQAEQVQAEDSEFEVLTKLKEVIGEEHPSTMKLMARLAMSYRTQGRLREAADMFERVTENRKKVLGLDHEDTLAVMGHLALTYRDQGQDRWTMAEDMFLQTIEGCKRTLGEDHDTTLLMVNSLGRFYFKQRRWAAAEQMFSQELKGRQRTLDADHVDILECMDDLAVTYRRQGLREPAKKLFSHLYEVRKRTLGENDPKTVKSKKGLDTS